MQFLTDSIYRQILLLLHLIVSYWKLLHKLMDDNVDVVIVQLLCYWYSNQQACVRWHGCMSDCFKIRNGTRQGGVLSPWFFARCVRDLLSEVVNSRIGCNIGGIFLNILAYADDIVFTGYLPGAAAPGIDVPS